MAIVIISLVFLCLSYANSLFSGSYEPITITATSCPSCGKITWDGVAVGSRSLVAQIPSDQFTKYLNVANITIVLSTDKYPRGTSFDAEIDALGDVVVFTVNETRLSTFLHRTGTKIARIIRKELVKPGFRFEISTEFIVVFGISLFDTKSYTIRENSDCFNNTGCEVRDDQFCAFCTNCLSKKCHDGCPGMYHETDYFLVGMEDCQCSKNASKSYSNYRIFTNFAFYGDFILNVTASG